MVFNDQPRDIYIYLYIYGRCPTVRTFLIRMPMYVRAFEYFAIEIQVLRKGRLSSLNNRSSGISNVPSSYVNVRQCACVSADC